MSNSIIDQRFLEHDFSTKKLPSREYDGCRFERCNFTEADISVITFLDCRFIDCDFTKVVMKQTAFRDACIFENCKLLGANFSSCDSFMFSVLFEACRLDYASFYGFEIKNIKFNICKLIGVDFTEAILIGSEFIQCDLTEATFDHTNIEKVDFRTAQNFSIDPTKNRVKKARFSKDNLVGLLTSYDLDIK